MRSAHCRARADDRTRRRATCPRNGAAAARTTGARPRRPACASVYVSIARCSAMPARIAGGSVRIDAAAHEIADQAAEHQFGIRRREQARARADSSASETAQEHRRFTLSLLAMNSRKNPQCHRFRATSAKSAFPGSRGRDRDRMRRARERCAQRRRDHLPSASAAGRHDVQQGRDDARSRFCASSGLATVRFNFRGVGKSEGEHDEGRGEADDLVAIARWVQRERPGDALWLAGFLVRKLRRAACRVAARTRAADPDRAAGRPLGFRRHRRAAVSGADRAGRGRRHRRCRRRFSRGPRRRCRRRRWCACRKPATSSIGA